MAMSNVCINENGINIKCSPKTYTYEKDMRRRIIALTGKDQYSLNLIQGYLISIVNVFKIQKVDSTNLTTDEFLDRILKGDIIEASCDDNHIITGTSKQNIEPGFLYVGIYTPHQLSNLLECKDPNLEILPVEIDMENKQVFNNILDKTKNVYEACKEYMRIEEQYDGDEFLDGEICLWKHYEHNHHLYNDIGKKEFEKSLKEFNKTYELITDLDNFI